jgi:hypothetical protein
MQDPINLMTALHPGKAGLPCTSAYQEVQSQGRVGQVMQDSLSAGGLTVGKRVSAGGMA